MKKLLFRFFLVVGLGSLVVLSACSDDDDNTPPQSDILEQATADGYTLFVDAVEAAGLTATLEGDGPFTIFVPSNSAIEAALTLFQAQTPADMGADTLASVMLMHLFSGKVLASELQSGYLASLRPVVETTEPDAFTDVYVDAVGGTIAGAGALVSPPSTILAWTGSNIVTTDVEVSNGVIHYIDRVIVPGGVSQMTNANPSLTTLYNALYKAELVMALSAGDDQGGPFTLFAPTNAAFEAAGIVVDSLDASTLSAVLTKHVVNASLEADELVTGTLDALDGSTLNVDVSAMQINGSANITATDINAINGVIHVIDEVIQ